LVKNQVLNIAHRGARSLAPENTLSAARAALKAGADMWETDVAVTSDEVLIIVHDPSLVRTTDAPDVFPDRSPWTCTDFSYREIQQLDAGTWFGQMDPFGQIKAGQISSATVKSYSGEKIPTLEQALIFTRDADWRINIELKQLPGPMKNFPVVERVLSLIKKTGIAPHSVALSSFNLAWVKQARRLKSDIEVHAVVGLSRVKPIVWQPLSFDTYNARHTLVSATKIKELSAKGVSVNVWTVNDKMTMAHFIHAGVTGIFTDFPQRLSCLMQIAV
jgi:glycerophosphoryl diester phosphodiesterase